MEFTVKLATPIGTLDSVQVQARDSDHALTVLKDMVGPVEVATISVAHTGECIWRGPPAEADTPMARIWRRMVTG